MPIGGEVRIGGGGYLEAYSNSTKGRVGLGLGLRAPPARDDASTRK